MTRPAMSGPLNEVGAAIPPLVAIGFWRISLRVGENQIPHRERPSHIQRPRNVRRPVGLFNGGYVPAKIRVEQLYFVIGELCIGRIWHCRIKTMSVLSDA